MFRMNPYQLMISEAKAVMDNLIGLMTRCEDMKLFKNIAAVYVVWQHEMHSLQLEEMNWRLRNA